MAEICSCALRIVNSIPPHTLLCLTIYAYTLQFDLPRSFDMSARLSPCISADSTGWIQVKLYTGNFMKICLENPNFVEIVKKKTWNLHENLNRPR